jgi:ATP-dependent Clp protease ATP-binding subunit ClpC
MNGYNFSERVRKVLARAREDAIALSNDHVDSAHLLISLLEEDQGVAWAVFRNLGVHSSEVADRLRAATRRTDLAVADVTDLPFTSDAKRVLERSMAAARELDHSYVGTEHLLLGLLKSATGIAVQALAAAGVTYESALRETLQLLGGGYIGPGLRRVAREESTGARPAPADIASVTILIDLAQRTLPPVKFQNVDDAIHYLQSLRPENRQ